MEACLIALRLDRILQLVYSVVYAKLWSCEIVRLFLIIVLNLFLSGNCMRMSRSPCKVQRKLGVILMVAKQFIET